MNSHRNAPLTPEGRTRLIERCRTRPIAHVAAEMGISRATASKWVNRYKQFGEIGLHDRSSAPRRQPTAIPGETVARIEQLRREHKWPASRIACELHADGTIVSRRTITRHLAQLGLNRRRFIDPNGENNREIKTITAKHPGHMVHLDVKKSGRIPDGGSWRVHGKNSPEARAAARSKTRGTRAGYAYLHSAIDGHLPPRGECSPHEAAQLARVVEEAHESDREAFLVWALSGDQIEDGDGLPSVSEFEERYCGTWPSFRDYAENLADDVALLDGIPDEIARYFDWRAWARDLAFD